MSRGNLRPASAKPRRERYVARRCLACGRTFAGLVYRARVYCSVACSRHGLGPWGLPRIRPIPPTRSWWTELTDRPVAETHPEELARMRRGTISSAELTEAPLRRSRGQTRSRSTVYPITLEDAYRFLDEGTLS